MDNTVKLQEVFRKVFGNNDLIIHPETTARDIRMWDSLTHLELIASVEEAFNISFTFNEVMQFNKVGDMLELIGKKTMR
jgi:acyl carrier protein